MKEKIKIGYVGCGGRGTGVLKACYSQMKDVEVAWVCDLCPQRMDRAAEHVLQNSGITPKKTRDYHDILADPEIDAVIIMTGWSGRPQIAIDTMRAGKYAAVEVGCADTLDECFELVRTYEETGVPVMMMENCCYDRREMMLLNMVKQGLFGELIHCTGAYSHYLPTDELFASWFNRLHDAKNPDAAIDFLRDGVLKDGLDECPPHYRLPHYLHRCRENYPTHAFGPISKILSLNRGNRMVKLTSHASKACALKEYAVSRFGADSDFGKLDYKQADIVTTVITCAGGETVVLTLDTTAPRAYYSRNIGIRGTLAMSYEDSNVVYTKGMPEGNNNKNNEAEFMEKYDHPLYREYNSMEKRGGHGGKDWLVCRAFVEAVKNGTDTPIDAYDTASWLAIGVLSEQSIAGGGISVDVPDFTGGKWKEDRPIIRCKYCLDEIVSDPDTPIY